MRVVSNRIVKLDQPTPVYDATSPKHHNLTLGFGCVVHNTAKYARFKEFQEVLKLKGKPLNSARATVIKMAENESIRNILVAIGYQPDASAKAGKTTARVNHIYLLSDPDPDGPLVGDTRVLTLDGKNPTIKELADMWKTDQKPFWVYSRDINGCLIPAQAIAPRHVLTVNEAIRITFDDGTVITCTDKHKWRVNDLSRHDSRVIHDKGQQYILAKNLQVGDSINSVYFDHRNSDGNKKYLNKPYLAIMNGFANGCDREVMPVHQWVMSHIKPKKFKKYRNLNSETTGGPIQIHHIDNNSLNNEPLNLKFLKKEDHFGHHGREMALLYNGSVKHLSDLSKFRKTKAGKKNTEQAIQNLLRYNVSQKHRTLVAEQNSEPEHKKMQLLGKMARYYLGLKKIGLSKSNWEDYSYPGVPKQCDNFAEVKNFIQAYGLSKSDGYELSLEKKKYPTQVASKFIALCREVQDKGLKLNEENYSAIREARQVRGDPKWSTGLELFGSTKAIEKQLSNHRVIKVEKITLEEPTEMYCLTVPSTGNFMVSDINGNGICSGNSHINVLGLTALWKAIPQIFMEGRVRVIQAPLYSANYKGVQYFADTLQEMKDKLPDDAPSKVIARLKGWGEATVDELRHIAFDPKTRKSYVIQPPMNGAEDKHFMALVGDDTQERKKILGL